MKHPIVALACMTALASFSSPALAQQTISAEDAAALRAELAALRSQVAALESRLNNQTAPAVPTAPIPVAAAPKSSDSGPKIAWKGAPEISDGKPGGWSFKPRGRVQIDAGSVSAPSSIVNTGKGFASEFRRVYLGAQGTIPGGFGYRMEFDFAATNVEITDAYLTYDDKGLNVTLGQHKPFMSLEDLTSDLDISLMERAAFVQAFGFERRIGISAGITSGNVIANAGVFTDNAADLSDAGNNSFSTDARIAWGPKFGKTQMHLAGSVHYRELNTLSATSVRYRARPGTHTTDIRFIATPNMLIDSEFGLGIEAAAISGPWHVAAEAFRQQPTLVDGRKPTFFGGYAEIGYFFTKGDSRSYKKGVFGAMKPARSIVDGGPGAIQMVLRYDRLDMNDAGIMGGSQNGYYAGVSWAPVEYVKFMLNYGHIEYRDAAISAAGDRNYGVDTMAMRAQFHF